MLQNYFSYEKNMFVYVGLIGLHICKLSEFLVVDWFIEHCFNVSFKNISLM